MELSEKEKRFVARRRSMTRLWPWIGTLILAIMGLFTLWLFVKNPLLVNPYETAERLMAGSIDVSMLQLMAALLPVAMLMCLVTALFLVLYTFIAFKNEKRHLAIIDRIAGQ